MSGREDLPIFVTVREFDRLNEIVELVRGRTHDLKSLADGIDRAANERDSEIRAGLVALRKQYESDRHFVLGLGGRIALLVSTLVNVLALARVFGWY